MFDARIFVDALDEALETINKHGAIFRGKYKIHDAIYASKDPNRWIDKVYLRLRHVPINIWNEKQFIVAIKYTNLEKAGKRSVIPIKKEFDAESKARDFIVQNYSDQFDFLYEFTRIGWQYDIGTDQIDLEEIEGYYSIEFKSKTEKGLHELLALFRARNVIRGPSVVTIRELLLNDSAFNNCVNDTPPTEHDVHESVS